MTPEEKAFLRGFVIGLVIGVLVTFGVLAFMGQVW